MCNFQLWFGLYFHGSPFHSNVFIKHENSKAWTWTMTTTHRCIEILYEWWWRNKHLTKDESKIGLTINFRKCSKKGAVYKVIRKKVREKSKECHNHKPSPSKTPRGRGNRQIQTSANWTNVRKALKLALFFPSEIIAMLKVLENTRTK